MTSLQWRVLLPLRSVLIRRECLVLWVRVNNLSEAKTALSTIWLVRCFGPIFRAEAAHVVLLGPVRIVQRTPDLFPDLGCVLQMFSDVCHRRMTAVPW